MLTIEEQEDLFHEHKQLIEAVNELLYRTLSTGNGGYATIFGPVLLGTLLRLTKYNMKDRELYHVKDKK